MSNTDNTSPKEKTRKGAPEKSENETPDIEKILEDKWMIRECDLYKEEYDECTSIKGRFHQSFIYGEYLDCHQWKKDYNNCCKWEDEKDTKAANAVIQSERNRRMERFRAHYKNNVWAKRDGPPSDWAAPLPEWMVKRDENTYLAMKAKEIKEGTETEEKKSSCAIM